MATFRLWRQADNQTFEVEARDEQHAVKRFGHELGFNLTLAEGPAAPEYMMGRIEKEPNWTPAPEIPVWEQR